MNCEFDYCIYNKNFMCILDNIEINSLGMCDKCIIVSILDKNLEKLKKSQLTK